MRVQFTIAGLIKPVIPNEVDLPSVPCVGDTVDIPGVSQAQTVVRTVCWYPYDDDGPMVYIVLGTRRHTKPPIF